MAMTPTTYSAPQAVDSAGRADVDGPRGRVGVRKGARPVTSVSPCGMELQGRPVHWFLDEARGPPGPALRVPHPRAGGTGLSTSPIKHLQ